MKNEKDAQNGTQANMSTYYRLVRITHTMNILIDTLVRLHTCSQARTDQFLYLAKYALEASCVTKAVEEQVPRQSNNKIPVMKAPESSTSTAGGESSLMACHHTKGQM